MDVNDALYRRYRGVTRGMSRAAYCAYRVGLARIRARSRNPSLSEYELELFDGWLNRWIFARDMYLTNEVFGNYAMIGKGKRPRSVVFG